MKDSKAFRQCLGKFATGVTVVTCRDSGGNAYGITANSFSSVSLEPPLVLWNIAKVSNSLQAYLDAPHFAVNILADDQQRTASLFARSDQAPFQDIEHSLTDDGAPMLAGTLALFECRTHAIHDCGDHYIIVGEVTGFRSRAGDPLLFFDGDYRKIE